MINQKQTFTDRATKFSIRIFRLVDTLPLSRSYCVIVDQLIKSATSIGANMGEAKAASSSVYWLQLLKELNNAPTDIIISLIDEAEQLAKVLAASIITMKKNARPNL